MKRMIVPVVLAAMAAATPVLASGSGSGGGGGVGGGFNTLDPFLVQQQRLEQQGRAQIRKRITCKACEYKDGITRDNAEAIALAVRGGKFELNDKDRQAVLAYLKQRYGV